MNFPVSPSAGFTLKKQYVKFLFEVSSLASGPSKFWIFSLFNFFSKIEISRKKQKNNKKLFIDLNEIKIEKSGMFFQWLLNAPPTFQTLTVF